MAQREELIRGRYGWRDRASYKERKKKWVIKEHPKKAPLNDLSPAEEAAQE